MAKVAFSVPLVVAKQRPRWRNKTQRMYTPKETQDAEQAIAFGYLAAAKGKRAGKSPVSLYITAHKSLPKGTPKKVSCMPFVQKPDWDNIGKLVSDALNGIAYEDDAQVVSCTVEKLDRTRGADRLEIEVRWRS